MSIQKKYFATAGHVDMDYAAQQIVDVGGKGLIFERCDFSYSIIERGYFHGATFKNCKFIGTRFIGCNFRSAVFQECIFEYSTFFQTIVSPRQVVLNLPYPPNQRKDVIQSLRANALSMGDYESNNTLLTEELKASAEHHLSIARYNKSYYRSRYSQLSRATSLLAYLGLRVEGMVWGYGISPLRLIIWVFIATSVLGSILAAQTLTWSAHFGMVLKSMFDAISQTQFALLDLSLVDANLLASHRILFAMVVAIRTVALGLFVTVLYRRYAR